MALIMIRRRALLGAAALLPLVAACTGQEIRAHPGQQPEGFAAWADFVPPFLLGPGDRIQVSYLRTPEMDEELTVRPDGIVNVRTAGTVPAIDLRPEELAERITAEAAGFLRNPRVTVALIEAASLRIYVGGQVQAPGVYRIPGRIGALEAVIQAGSFSPEARIREVLLIRRGPDSRPMLRTLDLGGFIEGAAVEDVPLHGGDILFVPRSTIAEVNLWINQFIERVVPFNRSFTYAINRDI